MAAPSSSPPPKTLPATSTRRSRLKSNPSPVLAEITTGLRSCRDSQSRRTAAASQRSALFNSRIARESNSASTASSAEASCSAASRPTSSSVTSATAARALPPPEARAGHFDATPQAQVQSLPGLGRDHDGVAVLQSLAGPPYRRRFAAVRLVQQQDRPGIEQRLHRLQR